MGNCRRDLIFFGQQGHMASYGKNTADLCGVSQSGLFSDPGVNLGSGGSSSVESQ